MSTAYLVLRLAYGLTRMHGEIAMRLHTVYALHVLRKQMASESTESLHFCGRYCLSRYSTPLTLTHYSLLAR